MSKPIAAISWSGGKDSCLALMRAWPDYDVRVMVTMFDEAGERSRSHGLRPDVVAAQADRMGLAIISERCSWDTYEEAFGRALAMAAVRGCEHVIFGDIFEDSHRAWTERLATTAGLVAHQPLWGEPTDKLVREFLDRGGRASIVTVSDKWLEARWLGQELSVEVIDQLTALGVDPCGERGEYHTVVTNCPLFSAPIELDAGHRVAHGGCHAVDLRVASPGRTRHAPAPRG
jgi:uncharacterized protein (TIGR00290 family)